MIRLLPLLCCLAFAATAQEAAETSAAPRIVDIEFSGNAVTQPRVMLREMQLAPGDVATPEQIEAARQAVQDLGLFRAVQIEPHAVEGGMVLIVTVQEKFYLLPLPRFDVKDSGEYAYGAQLRWANLFGLNHNLRVIWEQRDRKEQGVGRENTVFAAYALPQIADSRYNLGFSAAYTSRPVDAESAPGLSYDEQFHNLGVQVSRSLSDQGPPSQGWMLSSGVQWQQQDTSGDNAETPYGTATSVVAGIGFRDLHFKRYSEDGGLFNVQVAVATEGVASDYDQLTYTVNARRFLPLGQRAHRSLVLLAELGARHGGPPDNDAYELGGSGQLRGYDNDFLEGDAFYRVAAEFLSPLGKWDWLRGLVVLEAGNAFEQPRDASLGRAYGSLGLGVRLRVDWFVDLDIDFGYAIALGGGGDGGRFFAGRP